MKKCAVIVMHSHEIAKRADVVFHLKRGALQIKKKQAYESGKNIYPESILKDYIFPIRQINADFPYQKDIYDKNATCF